MGYIWLLASLPIAHRSSPFVAPLKKQPSRPNTFLHLAMNPFLYASRQIYILWNTGGSNWSSFLIMTVLPGLLLNNSSWYLYRSWYYPLVASSTFCMTIAFALFSFEMLTIANISSWIVVLILSKLHVGLAIMNFSYFSAILLAVTNLLSLLGGHVCKSFRLATC